MIENIIQVLAIQEHSPWGSNLSNDMVRHVCKICEKCAFKVQISRYQIVIIVKSIMAAHQMQAIKENGHIITNAFQIGLKDYAVIFSVHGIPHGKKKGENAGEKKSDERREEVRQSILNLFMEMERKYGQ